MIYRGSAASRGYGNKWRKARAVFLSRPENVFCVMCKAQGRMVAATVVDHIRPHKDDQALFWDESNWQPLCKPHHDSTKQRIELGQQVGCDASGVPLDSSHHWRA